MPIINDPDDITYELLATPSGTAIMSIDTSAFTFQFTQVGALSNDGLEGDALYSRFVDLWRTDATLIGFPFPMDPLGVESFEFINGWRPANDFTRNLIRTAGFAERDGIGGPIVREYAGAISLGALAGGDQPYYENDGTAVDFNFSGPVNEPVQIFGGPADGNFDRRSSLNLFAREQGKTYAGSTLSDIGVTTLTYQAYRFPLSNESDPKVTESDVTVDAYGVTITFHSTAQSRTIGSSSRDFGIIIDGNNRTAEEIYMAVQSALRKSTDIDNDSSSLIGRLAPRLLRFEGDTLKTIFAENPEAGGGGVYIDNFQANDTNRITFQDNLNVERQFPFVAAASINNNDNIQNDPAAVYRVFFTTNPAGNYGTTNAVLVNDNSGTPISGTVGGAASISFDFDYDGNVQGGRTAGTDADITIVIVGQNTAQPVVVQVTLTRAVGQNFGVVAPLQRTYSNP